MPWIISPSDPKAGPPFKVKNKLTGKVKGTHPSYERAKKQLAALYVHAPEEFQQDLDNLLDEFTAGGSVGGGQAGGCGTTSANVGSYAKGWPAVLGLKPGKRKKRSNPIASVLTPQAMRIGGREK